MLYLKLARRNFITFSFVLLLCSAMQAQETGSTVSLDIPNLIRETSHTTQNNARAEYAYKFSFFVRETDKKGLVKKTDSMVYETFVPSRLPRKAVSLPMIQLEKNGKPLSPSEIESQRKKAGAQLEAIARQAERDTDKPIFSPSDGNDYLSVSFDNGSVFSNKAFEINILQVLQGNEFSNPRNVSLAGRETILLDFTPRPNFTFKEEMRYFSKIKGAIWIDAENKKLVRLEGYPLDANLPMPANESTGKPSGAVIYEQLRVPEGYWFFSRAMLNIARYPNIFGKSSYEYEMIFSDYKRFRSEVQILPEDTPSNL